MREVVDLPRQSRYSPESFPPNNSKQARHGDQAHLPTQQPQAQARPRLPCPHGDCRRPQDPGASSCQGSSSPDCLTALGRASGGRIAMTVPAIPPTPVSPRMPALSCPPRAFRAPHASARRPSSRCLQGGEAADQRPSAPALPTSGPRPPRPGSALAVSRKVDPHAVGRNRIKRHCARAFRHLRVACRVAPTCVVAAGARKPMANGELREACERLLQRAGALPPPPPAGTMPPRERPASVPDRDRAAPAPRGAEPACLMTQTRTSS